MKPFTKPNVARLELTPTPASRAIWIPALCSLMFRRELLRVAHALELPPEIFAQLEYVGKVYLRATPNARDIRTLAGWKRDFASDAMFQAYGVDEGNCSAISLAKVKSTI